MSYLSPGVYVEEVDRGTKPIAAVGTAVAAFIGFTERAVDERDGERRSLLQIPTLVTNWTQYTQKFGGLVAGAYTPDSVYGFFANGGGRCYIISVKTLGASADPQLATPALTSIPSSEDKPAKLLTVTAKEAGPAGNEIAVEIKPAAESEKEEGGGFSVIVTAPGQPTETHDGLSLGRGSSNVATKVSAASKLITIEVVGRPAASVVPAAGTYPLAGGAIETKAVTLQDYQGDPAKRTSLGGLEPLNDITMICVPDLMASLKNGEMDMKKVQAVQQAIIDYCEQIKYAVAILDMPPHIMPQEAKQWREHVNYDSSRAALYYPWIEVMDPRTGKPKLVPPSGHVAGIYARSDAERGVHKAPANEVVRGAIGLEVQVTKGEQDMLNPIGVNCIRSFPGRGTRIWGARTLSSDPAWRYINVRRLFNMVGESIEAGTQWVVFEPNDSDLWARVRRDVSAFLKLVWRSGALFGKTPQEAFYVKVDEENNPPEVRDSGQLIIEVGLAPVKPAEFVIFRISQWAGPNAEA